jgi:adenylate cyclase
LACQTTITDDVALRRLVLDEDDIQLTSQLGPGATAGTIGEERMLAVMFADIRGFTSFAEALPPYDVVHLLNRFFRQMGRAINGNGGKIDNYMGDGLMALFGINDEGPAVPQSLKAGVAMLDEMDRLKPYLDHVYGKIFDVGIGVNYGLAVVGSVGSENMRRVTAIGDAVNLASRIEAANKKAGTRFLISQSTFEAARAEVIIGKTFDFSLPGKSGVHVLYEVTGLTS